MLRDPSESYLRTVVTVEKYFAKMNRYSCFFLLFVFLRACFSRQKVYLCDQRHTKTLSKWSSDFENTSKPSSSMLRSLFVNFEWTGSEADDKVCVQTKQKTGRRYNFIGDVMDFLRSHYDNCLIARGFQNLLLIDFIVLNLFTRHITTRLLFMRQC